MPDLNYPHLFIKNPPTTESFTSPKSGRDNINFPDRPDRQKHGRFVQQALEGAWKRSSEQKDKRQSASLPTRSGTYLEFESAPNFDLRTKSLDLKQSSIRLLNVSTRKNLNNEDVTYATIFVPHGKEAVLLKKIEQYKNEKTSGGKPKHEPLVASINNLREAILESFWRDKIDLIPKVSEWCEIWLRYSDDPGDIVKEFKAVCSDLNLEIKEGLLTFPERAVVLAKASKNELEELLLSTDFIAEYRKAKTTEAFWMNLDNSDKSEWAQSLAERIVLNKESNTSVCVLDTGINNGHILLEPFIDDTDCHTINTEWGVNDNHGHGTLMCGCILYGDHLSSMLQSADRISIPFRLESVKLIPSSGSHHDEELYGLKTQQAVSRVEIERPELNRIICLSITSEDFRDEGKPSSWSGSLDQICFGTEETQKRLVVVSAGNVKDPIEWSNYPASNITQAVHDPGQSWNAITVGAFTKKTDISNLDLATTYNPIAQEGQLSPFSTTSHIWDNKWPNKPDIIFEGGNAGKDTTGFATELDDLSILSTHHRPQESLLSVMNATSAATAQASQMAANLSALYPDAWPETIRALMIHSASWSEALWSQFINPDLTDKKNFSRMLRTCGYGIPDNDRAIESATNSLTLIAEQEIQPFAKKPSGNEYRTNDMHLFELPWPIASLNELPDETPVRIDITLSYFIQPGPGEIGWRDKYRYRSHGLDFDLISPTEEKEEFLKRLNKAARDDDTQEASQSGSSISWSIGSNTRNRGSVHRDWWETTAAEASACNIIGIFPRTGWWKERTHLLQGETKTRYSLIVTLKTESTQVDIYTPIANLITPEVEITV